ncbi:Uncharacterised protein [Mycolicibacterium flavescens]|nr:Uncharacterised protein [Mycolicibacterium flavescens]
MLHGAIGARSHPGTADASAVRHGDDYRQPLGGTKTGMTSPNENVTPEPTEKAEDVLSPATPGAEGLPLPDEAVDKPSEG